MKDFKLSELGENIVNDRNEARFANDKLKSSLLSTLLGDIQNKEADTDEAVIALVKKYIDNNNFTISKRNSFSVQGLIEENAILYGYLPKQMNEQEILEAMLSSGLTSIGDLMKYMKVTYPGKYNGVLASKVAKEKFS